MTIKEINTLRRNGNLEEATAAARAEFDRQPNLYSGGALFWCLYDHFKKQSGAEAEATVAEMRAIYEHYGSDDKIMRENLERAEARVQPLYGELKSALERAKGRHRVEGEYRRFAAAHDAGELPEGLRGELGWLIYYILRNTATSEADRRKELLSRYFRLGLEKPSALHSRILGEAIRLETDTPLQFLLRDFLNLWGLENLTDSDWEQFRTESGKVMTSPVEKLIRVYATEMTTDGVRASDEFNALVDKALERFPNNQNLPYHKALVLISQGNREGAISYLTGLIARFPTKFFLLARAAELVDDADIKIALLCKALTSGNDDEFLVKVRLRLASLLIDNGLQANARYELERYKATYDAHGWKVKPEYYELMNKTAGATAPADNTALYEQYMPIAEEFIYSALPSKIALKVKESQEEDRNRPGRKYTLWLLRTADGILRLKKPQKFGLSPRTPDGSLFSVKVKDGKVVWIKPFKGAVNEDWIKTGTGTVNIRTDRNGKRYAIIADAYVPEKLLAGLVDGQEVKVLATRRDDGRWSAVAVRGMR